MVFGGSTNDMIQEDTTPHTMEEMILDIRNFWMLYDTIFPEEGKREAESLKKGTATITCDVSFQPQIYRYLVTNTCIIEAHGGSSCIRSPLSSRNGKHVIDAYQAKLSGILL